MMIPGPLVVTKESASHPYHHRMTIGVETLGSFPYHILVPEKYVHLLMDHVQWKVLMVQEYLMLIISCLYLQVLHVS